jgi:hypothetical protein
LAPVPGLPVLSRLALRARPAVGRLLG